MRYLKIQKAVKLLILINYYLSDKTDLKRRNKYVALLNLNIYYTYNIIKVIKSNKFKISAPTLNDKFELPAGSYFVLDIQDYFYYIIKKHEALTITCQ